METIDIYHFINSADMRKYLRDISYQFSISEAGFVIYWSKRATLSEKISAWKSILTTLPDCALRRTNVAFESYHAFLRSYIDLMERDLEQFYSSSNGKSMYTYAYYNTSVDDSWSWYEESEAFFSDYSSCAAAIREELSGNNEITEIWVRKYPLDQQIQPSRLLMNRGLEVLELDADHEDKREFDISAAFEDCCFNFPSPFQRGDIVVCHDARARCDCRPFVLSYMTTWNSEERKEKGFRHDPGWPGPKFEEKLDKRVARLLDQGDFTDMQAIGYCVDFDGVVDLKSKRALVIDLEYYREPLEGFERQLKLFSCYKKGRASDIYTSSEMLVNGCFAIRLEELAKELVHSATNMYYKSDLLQLGVIQEESGTFAQE